MAVSRVSNQRTERIRVPKQFTEQKGLPPRVAAISRGRIKWATVEGIDYNFLGYFLCIHLIVEHYLDQFLKIVHPDLDWDASRLTFAHKISLLSKFKSDPKYDVVPAIKHLNSLRNRMSHALDAKVNSEDLLPFVHCVQKIIGNKADVSKDPRRVLEAFAGLVCSFLGGYIGGYIAARVEVRSKNEKKANTAHGSSKIEKR
jgi:hypothetical protein